MTEHENRVYLKGNIGNDIEIGTTTRGVKVCNLRLATNRRDGDQEYPTFNTVVCWDKVAEKVKREFIKGDLVRVIGSLQGRKSKAGYTSEVNVDEIHFCHRSKKNINKELRNEADTDNQGDNRKL